MKNRFIFSLPVILLAFLFSINLEAQNYFDNFPVKADPKLVGNNLCKRLLETKHQLYFDKGIHYAEVCTWYGALRFAEQTVNKDMIKN